MCQAKQVNYVHMWSLISSHISYVILSSWNHYKHNSFRVYRSIHIPILIPHISISHVLNETFCIFFPSHASGSTASHRKPLLIYRCRWRSPMQIQVDFTFSLLKNKIAVMLRFCFPDRSSSKVSKWPIQDPPSGVLAPSPKKATAWSTSPLDVTKISFVSTLYFCTKECL